MVQLQYPCHSEYLLPDFFSFFFLEMGASCDFVFLTSCVDPSKLMVLPRFIAVGAGLFFVVWPLCSILGGVFLEYFAFFCRVPGRMQQPFYPSIWLIACMACILILSFPSRPFAGLVGEADSSPFSFLS